MSELAIYEDADAVESIWHHLEAIARPPYVQSWGWVENWLVCHGQLPSLAVIHDANGAPIAAAFDGVPVLRTAAFPELGMTTDEFRVAVEREAIAPHVDLDTVRAVEGGYLATLPAAIRAHLLHARRQTGELEIEAATNAAHAHVILDELLALKRAPDDPFFRRLIDQRAPFGEIQLLRIRSNGVTLGCLYNTTWHDRVYNQLGGFAATADADICHIAAVEHAAGRGFAFYDLQPDRARLATGQTRRVWLRLERHRHRRASKLAG
jgi:hypothetical protein